MRHHLAVIALMLAAGCGDSRIPFEAGAPIGADSVFVADGQYQVIDLGTLGGSWARPIAINDAGQIAGVSQTASGVAHAFLWDNGVMLDLGALAGDQSEAHVINANGQVAGATMRAGLARAFLWDNGVMRDLGPDNASAVVARSIGPTGDVVATVYWDDERVSAVVWRSGVMLDLGSLNPTEPVTQALAAHQTGLVAGQSRVFGAGAISFSHPVLWDGSRLRDLGVLGPAGDAVFCATNACSQGLAADVNGAGQVVGWSTDSTNVWRAFMWENGTLRDLGAFPGRLTLAVSLNDRRQVAGEYSTREYSAGEYTARAYSAKHSAGRYFASLAEDFHAFIWEAGSARDLGSLGGDRTGVLAINEEGLITGYGTTSSGEAHAFIWRAGRMYDLGPGSPTALSERGDVVGVTIPPSPDAPRAILWRRVPPPVELAF